MRLNGFSPRSARLSLCLIFFFCDDYNPLLITWGVWNMKGSRVKIFMISSWPEGIEENSDELNLRRLQYWQDLGVLLLNSARLSDDFERGGEIAAWAAKKWKKYRIKKNCRLLLPSSRHTQIVYTFAILYAHRTNLLLLNFFFFIVHNPGAKIISGEKRMTCCISYHTAELALCLWRYVSILICHWKT